MGKPRLIILIRHAQSEGNKNRAIHQLVPDHRVKLTDEGWKQAEDAGQRLRALLRPDDTLQVFTSPYRRTRETTEGILRTLTAPSPTDGSPAALTREKIVVYEEPRLREQDFGNFQPCSAEMERMWRERADYGHFFYRIPNGESAADAYDRVSGFNESLWRQFGERDFPSVLVLVTHGLMSRVFLMKWYHWSVEYFEDLRNVNHCEFVLMRQNVESGKYILESQLRTWSELKRQRAEEAARKGATTATTTTNTNNNNANASTRNGDTNPSRRNTLSAFLKHPAKSSPSIPARQWGGCPEGCNHNHHHNHNHEEKRKKEAQELNLPPSSSSTAEGSEKNEADDHPLGNHEANFTQAKTTDGTTTTTTFPTEKFLPVPSIPPYLAHEAANANSNSNSTRRPPSGAATPHECPSSDDEEANNSYFPNTTTNTTRPTSRTILKDAMRQLPQRSATPEDIQRWVGESGMGAGKHADALGDEPLLEFEPEEEEDGGSGSDSGSDSGDGGSARGREVGRNAVERLVEEHMDEKERGVRESVY